MVSEYNYKEEIGRHLGRTTSGELMTPYSAPTKHDPGLLVAIPRSIGREKSGITANFIGADIWHAYEFSFLLPNNQPVTGVLKFSIPADSPVMIESKSFKLYLNSFDFEQFASASRVVSVIESELSLFAESNIQVDFFVSSNVNRFREEYTLDFHSIDSKYINRVVSFVETDSYEFTHQEHSDVVDRTFHTSNLRSACEITNQKDTGNCFIAMRGQDQFELEDLAAYIFTLRNGQHFHENVTEIIYNTLIREFNPTELIVANIYNRRGGLDIHPIRATSLDFLSDHNLDFYLNVDEYISLTDQV